MEENEWVTQDGCSGIKFFCLYYDGTLSINEQGSSKVRSIIPHSEKGKKKNQAICLSGFRVSTTRKKDGLMDV